MVYTNWKPQNYSIACGFGVLWIESQGGIHCPLNHTASKLDSGTRVLGLKTQDFLNWRMCVHTSFKS